jgi:hypothetical protein
VHSTDARLCAARVDSVAQALRDHAAKAMAGTARAKGVASRG